MNKEYFFVKPSSFVRLGDIDIDGNYEYVPCKDFDVSNPKENYLIFEVRYEEHENGKVYYPQCKEIITGNRFELNIEERTSRKTRERVETAIISSDEIGLYSKILPLRDILAKQPSRVPGLFFHFQDNEEDKLNYCGCLREMIEEAQAFKHIYDTTVDGPSRYLLGQMKKAYRKSRR